MKYTKCADGFIKITIPGIGVTWARDLKDAEKAIAEAIQSHRVQKQK
jgi:hypothetical protein